MMSVRGYHEEEGVERKAGDLDSYRRAYREELKKEYGGDKKIFSSLLEELDDPSTTVFLTRVYKLNEDNYKDLPDRILVYFAKAEIKRFSVNSQPEEKKQISTAHIADLIKDMDSRGISEAILIADSTLGPTASKKLRELTRTHKVVFFLENEVLINPNESTYSPLYELLTPEEAKQIMRKSGTTLKNYAPRPRSQPQVKYLGARGRSLIRVTHKNGKIREIKYFRVK